jgi:hypothetical protein
MLTSGDSQQAFVEKQYQRNMGKDKLMKIAPEFLFYALVPFATTVHPPVAKLSR